MANAHVPKFGSWDDDESGSITAYFESARRDKSGVKRINPNDPEENPEAFNLGRPRDGNNLDHHSNTNDMSVASESNCHKSLSDHSTSTVKPNRQHKRSDRNKYATEFHLPPSPADEYSCRLVSVPKFGEWDGNDTRTGEGFTVIFNKVKEEKQIAAAKFRHEPIINSQTTSQKKKSRSKRFFCLF